MLFVLRKKKKKKVSPVCVSEIHRTRKSSSLLRPVRRGQIISQVFLPLDYIQAAERETEVPALAQFSLIFIY